MLTLIIDTSHKYLAVGLANSQGLLVEKQDQLKQQQSEFLLPYINAVFKESGLDKKDITRVVVTDGPGSYTGMRIALTFVKTLSLAMPELKVYTINTLLSLSGLNSGFAFIDGRSKRIFGAYIKDGKVMDERIYQLEELLDINQPLYGDTNLIDLMEPEISIVENILDLKDSWKQVETIDLLVPRYLK